MWFLIVFAIIFLLYLFLVFPSLRRHSYRKKFEGKFFAHRGLHNEEYPENSIPAFANAVANGYGIELDIHLTRDNELVVFHDSTLERMCGVDEPIEEKTLEEIREYNLLNTNDKIPTFKEVLSLIDGKVPLIVELKSMDYNCDALCLKADECLKEYKGLYCIESFNPMAVAWYKKNRKDIFRGQLAMNTKGKPFVSKVSSAFLLNFLTRPDFVAFDESFSNSISFKIQKVLGAFSVGWTINSLKNLEDKKKYFKTYIFENFKP